MEWSISDDADCLQQAARGGRSAVLDFAIQLLKTLPKLFIATRLPSPVHKLPQRRQRE
jgi:hypothetical protein